MVRSRLESLRYANKAFVARQALLKGFQGPNRALSCGPLYWDRPAQRRCGECSWCTKSCTIIGESLQDFAPAALWTQWRSGLVKLKAAVLRVGEIQPHTVENCFLVLGHSRLQPNIGGVKKKKKKERGNAEITSSVTVCKWTSLFGEAELLDITWYYISQSEGLEDAFITVYTKLTEILQVCFIEGIIHCRRTTEILKIIN